MSANRRRNFDGNFEDETGGSYYVVDETGEKVAGPFGSGPYATTVHRRFTETWPRDVHIEYES